MTKVLAVRVPNELYSEFCNYKQRMKFSTDSEALRDILRRFLLEGVEEGDNDA